MQLRGALLLAALVAGCGGSKDDGAPPPTGSPTPAAGGARAAPLDYYRRALGPTAASPGPLFDGLVPGGPASGAAELAARLRSEAGKAGLQWMEKVISPGDLRIAIEPRGETIATLELRSASVACNEVVALLDEAWPGGELFAEHLVWTDRAAGRHAALHLDTAQGCGLGFWPWTTASAWLDDPLSPLALIGTSSAELVGRLGSAGETIGTRVYWYAPGIGTGVKLTYCDASIATDRVGHVSCGGHALPEIAVELTSWLTARFGKPETLDAFRARWKAKRPALVVELERRPTRWELIVATP